MYGARIWAAFLAVVLTAQGCSYGSNGNRSCDDAVPCEFVFVVTSLGDGDTGDLKRYQSFVSMVYGKTTVVDLWGLTELFHNSWNDRPANVLCQGQYRDAAQCMGWLAFMIGNGAEGEFGISYRSPYLTLIPGSARNPWFGPYDNTWLYGARFQGPSYPTDVVIPFVVTHTSPYNDGRQVSELRDIVDIVEHDVYQFGDVPPIIVGDFNCSSADGWSTPDHQAKILPYYWDASADFKDVLRVFVGRPSAFPFAKYQWVHSVVQMIPIPELQDPNGTNSDHSGLIIRLRLQRVVASDQRLEGPITVDPNFSYGIGCPTSSS